jgi:heme-degrading monooxygenase HmoA
LIDRGGGSRVDATSVWRNHDARVTTVPGLPPERIKATLAEFTEQHLPRLEQEPGFCGVWAGVDYPGGRAIAVTYWESNDAMYASDALANEVRAAAVTRAGVDRERRPVIDRYEVVLDRHGVNA